MSDLFRSLASRARQGAAGGRVAGPAARLRPALDLSVAYAFPSSPEPGEVSPDAWPAQKRWEPIDPVEGLNAAAPPPSTERGGRPRAAKPGSDHPEAPLPFDARGRQPPLPLRTESTLVDDPAAAVAAPRVRARVAPLHVESGDGPASPAFEDGGSDGVAAPAAVWSPPPVGASTFRAGETPGSERGNEEISLGAGGQRESFVSPRLSRSEIAEPGVGPEERVAIERLAAARGPRAASTPTIRVSIGRIEVRAVHPPSASPAPIERAPTAQALSLEDYLKRRAEGRNG